MRMFCDLEMYVKTEVEFEHNTITNISVNSFMKFNHNMT